MNSKYPIQAKKSLGQHFLNSKHVLEQIVAAAAIESGQNILEIGPGTGILTKSLLAKGAKVIAIEKDVRSCVILKEKFAIEIEKGKLTLIEGDVLDSGELESALSKLTSDKANIAQNKAGGASFDLVANIPYYITGAILEKFLENGPRPGKMVLLVQKEVAERIVARNGKESVLSVSVKAFGEPKIIAKVPRGAFTPPPTVDSAILAIYNITNERFLEKKSNIRTFFDILKAGFAHKRKFLKKNLEVVLSKEKINEIWQKIGLDEKVRAEDIETTTWINIASTE